MDKSKQPDKQSGTPSGKPNNPTGPTTVDGSKMKPIDKGSSGGPGGGGKKG